jgi:CrcB protein
VTPVLVAVGAAVGAAVRFLLGHLWDGHWPTGTLVANVTGSVLLGACAGWSLDGQVLALVGVGFCGALTTYSSFAVQTHERGRRVGGAYAGVTLLLALAGSAVGFALTV